MLIINFNFEKGKYYIELNNCPSFLYSDNNLANYLGMGLDQYHDLGKQCNGYVNKFNDLYFENKKDAEKFLNKLTPYIILRKLINNN